MRKIRKFDYNPNDIFSIDELDQKIKFSFKIKIVK